MNAHSAYRDGAERSNCGPGGESADGWGRAAAYDATADGLHTYALWSLRDHDAAVDALYCAFVIADRNVTQLRQPDLIHPWLYAILRRECAARAVGGDHRAPTPVSGRRPAPHGAAEPGGPLDRLERSLRRAEFHSLEWSDAEGLTPAHREILELTIRHGLDSRGLGLVLGLNQAGARDPARTAAGARSGAAAGGGPVGAQGFGVLADAWRELERSLAAVAVARGLREAGPGAEHCARLAELTFGWSGRLTAILRGPLTDHVDRCSRCQNYLHTVVGTPAAPTILPFVAAPHSLRELVLGELTDPALAAREGVDHQAIAARAARFTPEGFPALAGSPQPRRSSHRRTPKRVIGRTTARATNAEAGDGACAEAGSLGSAEANGALNASLTVSPSAEGHSQPAPRPGENSASGLAATTTTGQAPRPDEHPAHGSTTPGSVGTGSAAPDSAADEPDVLPEFTDPAAPGLPLGRSSSATGSPAMPLLLRKPVPPGPLLHVLDPQAGSHSQPWSHPLPAPDIAAGHAIATDPDSEPAAVYRVPGSWADRVLPTLADEEEIDTVETKFPRPGQHRSGSSGSHFVETPSGRFAATAPPEPTPTLPVFPPFPSSFASPTSSTPSPASSTPAAAAHAAQTAPPHRVNAPAAPRSAEQARYRNTDPGRRRSSDLPLRPASANGTNTATGADYALRHTTDLPLHAAADSALRYSDPAIRRAAEQPGYSGSLATSPSSSVGRARARARARARHKSKPVRQAVISAVALGAVGAVAAASAVVLGLTSSDHSAQALDSSPADPLVTTGTGNGGLSVIMSPGAGPSVPVQTAAQPTPTLTGSVITTKPAQPGSPPNSDPAADFFVSVNQRSADPSSVSILLRNAGTSPIAWSATPRNSWITLSRSSGSIPAGGSATITANATAAAPGGQWTSQVGFAPGNQVLVLHGGLPTTPPTSAPTSPTTPPTSAPPTTTAPTTPPATDPPTTAAPTAAPTATATAAPTSTAKPTPAPPRHKR